MNAANEHPSGNTHDHVRLFRNLIELTFGSSRTWQAKLAAAALSCLTMQSLPAVGPPTTPNVRYTATGVFSSQPISGFDGAGLAGQPFTLQVTANESQVGSPSGPTWAVYQGLAMTATVNSSEQGPPITFQSDAATILLAVSNPAFDLMQIFATVYESNLNIHMRFEAHIQLPKGTLASDKILPFTAPFTVSSSYPATLEYACAPTSIGQPGFCLDNQRSTTLEIATGTLTTVTAPVGPNKMMKESLEFRESKKAISAKQP